MKIVFAGGGTAGHINPALAIAQTVKEKNPHAEILFIGNQNSMEEKLVRHAGFEIKFIKILGLNRKNPLKNIQTMRLFFKAVQDAKQMLKDFAPDLAVGTGGYVSAPVLFAATKLGIPTCIHEQNAYPGVTSKMLARRVDKVFISFENSAPRFHDQSKLVLTGNPLRTEFQNADRAQSRKTLGLSEEDFYVLSFGGSLGATALNKAMCGVLEKNAKTHDFCQCHAMGKLGCDWMPQALLQGGVDIQKADKWITVKDFIYDMSCQMAAADVVICRSGAITLGEVMAQGKPAVLIPSPNVTHNHQYYNAMSLVERDAALLLEEKDLSSERLYDMLLSLKNDPQRRRQLSANAKKMALPTAAQTIYEEMMSLL